MNKKLFTFQLLFIVLGIGKAQNSMEYNLKKYAVSSQTVVDERRWYNNDLENSQHYVARSIISLVDYMKEHTDSGAFSYLHGAEHNMLAVSFNNTNTAGQFIHFDGKRQTFGQLLAGGELHLASSGTLFGAVSYQRGELTCTSLNYATHPEDYTPYFVADTLGKGTMNQERYTIYGGYSFGGSRWKYGFDMRYEGIAQAKKYNPQHANYTHSVVIGLGIAGVWQQNIIALALRPEWSRQSITAHSLLDGVRFLEFYGFGQWNRRESMAVNNYGRQQTLRGFGTEVVWMHDGPWVMTVDAGWKYRKMNSEESNFKELFSSQTHHFYQQFMGRHQSSCLTWLLQLSAKEYLRKGLENVYEQQLQDAEGLFDYVKVGTNQLYNSNGINMDLRAKVICPVMPLSSISMLATSGWSHEEERYDSPQMKIVNQTMSASLGVEYKWHKGRLEWEAMLNCGLQSGCGNSYQVMASNNTIQEIMAYTPYLLRGESRQTLEYSLLSLYRLSERLSLGGFLKINYLNSAYREQVHILAGGFFLF